MKKGSTLFLKIALFLIGTPVLVLGVFGLPWLVNHPFNTEYDHVLYPIIVGMCLTAIPFYIALYKAYKLLSYIDKNEAFSQMSVQALMHIRNCAVTISALYIVMMPFVYVVAEKDDAPGMIVIEMVLVFASMVIAVFAAVLQRLLQQAIDIKLENDLTV